MKPSTAIVFPHHSNQKLSEFIALHKTSLNSQLKEDGAILFQGFNVNNAQDFENAALEFDSDLKNNYLGTSPRNSITKFTFSASELPSFYPIPQHCEMSFLKFPPRRLFFYCHTAPRRHGETPVCDFRKVAQHLDPHIKQQFEEKGILTIRNYDGPAGYGRFDLWKLKRWDEVFGTTDKGLVEETCRKNYIEWEWLSGDKLRLYNRQPAFILHPETGQQVWFNHTQVFHRDAAAIEYAHIARRQPSLQSLFFNALTHVLTWHKKLSLPTQQLGTHTRFGDDTEIPTTYVEHLQQTIWRFIRFTPWKKGDVLALDNFSTSHGRMPYNGPREVFVCWASE